MASEDPQINEPCPAGKRKYITLKIPQKPEIIKRLQSCSSQSVVMTLYDVGSLTL
jgi:hypothetical protein